MESPPPDLGEEARRAWEHYAQLLRECGLVTVLDIPAFTILCEHFGIWQHAINKFNAVGMLDKTPNDYTGRR